MMEFNFFVIFQKYKKFILSFVVVVTLIAIIIVFGLPPGYQVVAKIYSKEFDDVPILYEAVKNEVILNGVVDEAELVKVFGVKNKDQARKKLKSITKIILDSRNNVMELRVRWENPKEAFLMANAFLGKLQEMYPAPLEALKTESKISKCKNDLKTVQERLLKLKETKSVLFGNNLEPTKIAEEIGRLKGNIALNEEILFSLATSTEKADLSLIKKRAFESIVKNQKEINVLKGNLFDYLAKDIEKEGANKYFYLNNLEQLTSEAEIYSNFLSRSLTQKSQLLTWQILQKPSMPEEPIGPNRSAIIVFTAIMSFLVSLFLAYLVEVFKKRI